MAARSEWNQIETDKIRANVFRELQRLSWPDQVDLVATYFLILHAENQTTQADFEMFLDAFRAQLEEVRQALNSDAK